MHAYSGWKLKQAAVTTLLIFTTVTASMGGTSNGVAGSGPVATSASNAAGGNSGASNATAAPAKAEASASAAGPITESQFEELRGLIEAQGEQLKAQQETIVALKPHFIQRSEPAAVPLPQWRRGRRWLPPAPVQQNAQASKPINVVGIRNPLSIKIGGADSLRAALST